MKYVKRWLVTAHVVRTKELVETDISNKESWMSMVESYECLQENTARQTKDT